MDEMERRSASGLLQVADLPLDGRHAPLQLFDGMEGTSQARHPAVEREARLFEARPPPAELLLAAWVGR
jgi:hypothetical protein